MTVVLAPLRVEAWALGARRTGMGVREAAVDGRAVVIGGLCGAVDPSLRPGDLVIASEVRVEGNEGEPIRCATDLAEVLGARVGPIVSLDHVAGPAERATLGDALAVDMESYWLVRSAGDRPVTVVRAVVDRAGRRLLDPRTLVAGPKGLLALRRAAPALRAWAPTIESRS
jgi:4-hydroxy-3-methylbut-2-en-1-yl diphosphate reductase